MNKKNKITNYLVKVTRKLNTAGRNKIFSIDYFICHLFKKMSQVSHHELQHLQKPCFVLKTVLNRKELNLYPDN